MLFYLVLSVPSIVPLAIDRFDGRKKDWIKVDDLHNGHHKNCALSPKVYKWGQIGDLSKELEAIYMVAFWT